MATFAIKQQAPNNKLRRNERYNKDHKQQNIYIYINKIKRKLVVVLTMFGDKEKRKTNKKDNLRKETSILRRFHKERIQNK